MVSINLTSLHAERTGEYTSKDELFFDVNAKLEEQKRENSQVTLSFNLAISTKPNVVKYSTAGLVTLAGKPDDIKKKLEVNPKTHIPQILFTIYQHVFNSIYILSSNLNTPYPPPDLLHPMAEKIQIISVNASDSTSPEKTEATSSATTTASEQNASKSLK
jgi:hypothetical protein